MIEAHSIEKSGFCPQVIFEGWKTAFITYSEDYGDLMRVKRHLKTDEVVILIQGEATLYTLEGDTVLEMPLAIGKTYNVKAGTWHHIRLGVDAMGYIVENSNTTKENTEVREIATTTKKEF